LTSNEAARIEEAADVASACCCSCCCFRSCCCLRMISVDSTYEATLPLATRAAPEAEAVTEAAAAAAVGIVDRSSRRLVGVPVVEVVGVVARGLAGRSFVRCRAGLALLAAPAAAATAVDVVAVVAEEEEAGAEAEAKAEGVKRERGTPLATRVAYDEGRGRSEESLKEGGDSNGCCFSTEDDTDAPSPLELLLLLLWRVERFGGGALGASFVADEDDVD